MLKQTELKIKWRKMLLNVFNVSVTIYLKKKTLVLLELHFH